MEINWNAIDKKWQKKWLENNDHETDSNNKEKKFITVAYQIGRASCRERV